MQRGTLSSARVAFDAVYMFDRDAFQTKGSDYPSQMPAGSTAPMASSVFRAIADIGRFTQYPAYISSASSYVV